MVDVNQGSTESRLMQAFPAIRTLSVWTFRGFVHATIVSSLSIWLMQNGVIAAEPGAPPVVQQNDPAVQVEDSTSPAKRLLPPAWNPKHAGDRVLSRLIKVTSPKVKGAHDSELAIHGDRAYIVAEVNDDRAGEAASWPSVYVTLSIVNLKTNTLEKVIPFARGEQVFENETLPVGACFVPRIIQKDATTLRCFFASEQPSKRQSQLWFIDFALKRMMFENTIHRVKLKTSVGTFDAQPRHFHADAVAHGFKKPSKDYGFYLFDSFKVFDGATFVTINNYPGKQNALAMANDALDTFEVLGHYNQPHDFQLSESSVNRLPDGQWLAICRQDGGNRNYTFTTSRDGKAWTPNAHRTFILHGTNSKPTFDRFGEVYYLGWQEATRVGGAFRSVFNIDVSRDGKTWERKYRFETDQSFQYPSFCEHEGTIYLSVTQGRKERIMFGRLQTEMRE